MKRCILDGEQLADLNAVYDALAAQLDLPGHFGRNLDALWDVLTTEIAGPIEIEWRNAETARQKLGPDFVRIHHLLIDAAAARRDLRLLIA